jgi:hypothetical protein
MNLKINNFFFFTEKKLKIFSSMNNKEGKNYWEKI